LKGAIFEERLAQALASPAKLLNWRDTASYAFIGELGNQQLAWEFLRRCPEYRADFDGWFVQWQALAQSGKADAYSDWRPVHEQMEALCDKWSLWAVHGLGVPASALPPEFRDEQTLPGPMLVSHHLNAATKYKSPRLIDNLPPTVDISPRLDEYVPSATIRLHLDQPIKKQLAIAEQMLKKLAEQNGLKPPKLEREDKRPSRLNLARYIQVLDATLDNQRPCDIARALYGDTRADQSRVRDHLKAASKLARSGYLGLYRAPER
jgi:hypothetical protein